MSSISTKINSDYLEAYKAHDEEKVNTLRLIKGAIKNAEIAKKAELLDQEVIGLLKREVKLRRDSAETYKRGNREDLASKELAEIKIITAYLPKEMDEAELRLVVSEVVAAAPAGTQIGKLIGEVIKQTQGQADNTLVAKLVNEMAQNKK